MFYKWLLMNTFNSVLLLQDTCFTFGFFYSIPDPRLMTSAMTLQVVTLVSSEDLLELSDLHVPLTTKINSQYISVEKQGEGIKLVGLRGILVSLCIATNKCST